MRGLPGWTRTLGHRGPSAPDHPSRSTSNLLILGLVAFCVAQLAYGLLLIVFAPADLDGGKRFVPLVATADWQVDGDMFVLGSIRPPTEVPAELTADPRFVLWRTWSPQKGNTSGSVTSPWFPTPEYVAIPYQGAPGESAGNRIVLQCDATQRELQVATGRTPEFSTVFLQLGRAFCAGRSRLIASSDGAGFVAVGTPYETTARQFHLQNDLAPRVALALAAIVLLTCTCFVAHFAAHRWLRYTEPLLGGLALIGCLGMFEIALFVATPYAAPITIAMVVALLAATVLIARRDPSESRRWWLAARRPVVLWSMVSIAYVALMCAADSGGGSWAANSFFSPLRWSTDNQLPMIVAEAFYGRTPPGEILISAWHGFDRTPLLSGLLLPFRAVLLAPLVSAGQSMLLPIGYSVISIALLSLWVVMLHEGCRAIGMLRAATFAVALAAVCPFFVFNTVYVWPKLLGGGFAVLAFCLLYRLSSQRRSSAAQLSLVAIFASCSYLSHASNAFVLLAIAIYFVAAIVRQGLRPIAIATCACALLVLSWTAFVDVTQPHSNALLRYAVANDMGFADRSKPLWDSAVTAYGNLGWAGWFHLKAGEFQRLFLYSWFSNEMAKSFAANAWAGASRVSDFATLVRSLGLASFAALIALILPRTWSSGALADATRPLAIVGIGAVAFTVLAQLPEAVTHQLPYGAAMLIFMSGASLIHALGGWRRAFVLGLTVAYGLFVWVYDPVASGLHHNVAAIWVLVELAVLALCVAMWRAGDRGAVPGRQGGPVVAG